MEDRIFVLNCSLVFSAVPCSMHLTADYICPHIPFSFRCDSELVCQVHPCQVGERARPANFAGIQGVQLSVSQTENFCHAATPRGQQSEGKF